MVEYLLGGSLVLIGLTMLLLRSRISSAVDGQTPTGRPGMQDGLRSDHGWKVLIVCSLLILGGTAMMLGAALA